MTGGRNLGLPIAIVVGSSIIGISLYLGLSRRPAGEERPPVAPMAAPAPSAPAPSPSPVPAPRRIAVEEVQRQAQAALEIERVALVRACWTPPAADEPESITLDYDITFGPGGEIVMIAISERRDANRSSVARCVRAQPRPVLPVEPPGENVRVNLSLSLP